MRFFILASGSGGNCSVIQSESTTILIDCGITKKNLTQKFHIIGLEYQQIDGMLITHTHYDHTGYIAQFKDIKKYAVAKVDNCQKIEFYQAFTINDLKITPLALSHDSEDTTGYLIQTAYQTLVYITDTGFIGEENLPFIRNVDYYIMESNHDVQMLLATNRPLFLKRRIINDVGHLSNIDSAMYLVDALGDKTKEIVLVHVSLEANTESLAYQTLTEVLQERNVYYQNIKIGVATQSGIYSGGKL